MNLRSPRFLLLLVVIIALIVGISVTITLIYNQSLPRTNSSVESIPPLPTPGSARTIYTNPQFAYTINYPTQWSLISSKNNSSVRVFLKHDVSVPEGLALEITCFANPSQLDAHTMWQQTQPPDGRETESGATTFSSGVTAYVAKGQGQTPYTVYTLVHSQIACQIVTAQTDPLNAQVVLATVNSFRWQ